MTVMCRFPEDNTLIVTNHLQLLYPFGDNDQEHRQKN